ncbi:gp74 [Synechococcus phage syn9]|uniref:Gp74 n=1 Tax=Synechococcus phage syn9 TaxID=382359 RepID=Q0QZF4_BPSYS|nr:gp74 [Synechococcus phage syn9]ABA47043.1 gp74 [Synechococcus phage syn9]
MCGLIMRIFLAAIVVIIGTTIGVNAINAVSNMQDAKMTRFCKSIPVGASYDEMCKDFR